MTDDLLETPDALLQALDGGGTMSESAKLRVLAAAHTARRSGRKPSALFVTLARDPGSSIPLADEDAGRRDLMQLQGRSPGPRKSTATVQVRPGLRVRVPEHERAGATPIGELLKGVC